MSEELSFNLDQIEKIAIELCLEHTHGNKTKAARLLGIGNRSLYNKLNRHGLFKSVRKEINSHEE
jgi:two-component system NtrC family response regulator